MSRSIPIGIKGLAKLVVDGSVTANRVASGALEVFSTPMMIGLGEKAAFDSVEKLLGPGQTTVGTNVTIDHLAATPIAMTVTAESTLTKQEKRILHFDLIIRDEVDVIGKGTHSRAIVDVEKFMKRVQEKAAKKP